MENRSDMAECLCEHPGCGCSSNNSSPSHIISLSVSPTTGGQFQLTVPKSDSIENLKKLISKKLKVPKERICLLYRERQLREGTVEDNQLVDGSRLTLLPSVETGLLAQRPEQSVMQALESLNDSQVNDFLSGKAPLNLTMRLGDHMMLIQLQLSTVAPGPASTSSSSCSSSSSATTSSPSLTTSSPSPPQTTVTTASSVPNPSSSSQPSSQSSSLTSTSSSTTTASTTTTTRRASTQCDCASSVAVSQPATTPTTPACRCDCGGAGGASTLLDTRALAEASRNLTQTLKQLSSEVLTSKSEHSSHEGMGRRQGAIIESMHHHGKGVYSGTFSGTLNPALQDKFGRPKRDISTIIHILNDLLCATPQYRAVQQGSAAAVQQGLTSSSSSVQNGLGSQIGSSSAVAVSPASPASPSTSVSQPTNSRLNSGESVTAASNSSPPSAEESLENRATRGKMERLRLVLGQRRERRRAMRSRPYPSPSQPSSATTQHSTPTPDSVTA